MISLFLETATDVCSVAVADGDKLLSVVAATEVHQHASHLTIFIRQALRESALRPGDLDRIVLSDGPGSYTSLRVGAATAKGLCVALPGLTLAVAPTLTSLALAAEAGHDLVLATVNSRKGEVYGQLFQMGADPETSSGLVCRRRAGAKSPIQNVRLTTEGWRAGLTAETGPIHVVGPGRERVAGYATPDDRLTFGGPDRCGAELLLAVPVREVDVAAYEPYYLNPPFVTRSKKKLLG